MVELNGYTLDGDWKRSSNGQYVFASKDGNKYFIKTYMRPKYPNDTASRIYAQRKKDCDNWVKAQNDLIKVLKSVAGPTGNVVVPKELFRDGVSFYKVTLKVNMETLSPSEIAILPDPKEKLLFLKTLVGSVWTLHRVHIVHGDLKPENILISKSGAGKLISKITDFDDSYFENKQPTREMIIGTPNYYSPELGKYIGDDGSSLSEKITCKSDVFALGIIFHEYLTGRKPMNTKFPKEHAYSIVGGGYELVLDSGLSSGMIALLKRMLHVNPVKRPDCGEVLAALREIEKTPTTSRSAKGLTDGIGHDGIKQITQLSTNYKIEYESGKVITVPYIYIKTHNLEDRIDNG